MPTQSLFDIAHNLVQTRIPGTRKGSDVPAWTHSVRVHDLLKDTGAPEEVCLAGLLHDIVEDGETSLEDLSSLGFSDRTVELVSLCSHDVNAKEGDARWVKMMARLADTHDADAWLIKIADILDNARSAHTMPPHRERMNKQAKVPIMLSVTKEPLGEHVLWKTLEAFYHESL